MRPIQALLSVVGRALLVAIFLASALTNHIPNFAAITEKMSTDYQIPEARWMHIGAIAFMLIGGVSVLLGFWARFGALLLGTFLVLANYYVHDFWTFPQDQQQPEIIAFMKNVALLGAMVMIIANGPGAGSVDKRRVTINV